MTWRDRAVLVTGAGGFIGSHLTERLVAAGASVRAFVHYNALGSRGWLDGHPRDERLEIVAADICDADAVRAATRGVEVVFHLAALIGIPYSYVAPYAYVRTNIGGTLNVLQAAREHGVMRVVHTSTSEVYGTARRVPIDESHTLQAQSPYAATKVGADKLVEAFALSYGVPAVTVRPFNTFGPRQSMRAVIPTIIAQCLSGGPVRLGNTRPTRDLNYVDNTVEGFLLAAAADAAVGQTINLGTGRDIAVGDLAQLIARLTGANATIEQDAHRTRPADSEVDRLVADASRARELLGWTPAVTLEDGLRRTIEWMRAHPAGLRQGAYAI